MNNVGAVVGEDEIILHYDSAVVARWSGCRGPLLAVRALC